MDIYTRAYLGAKAADALAMPVHWYYDTAALDRDYSGLREYRAPAGRHPDSILWRSSYEPADAEGDILHDQAVYWGRKGIHYHQFLEAGENTLNFRLADELYRTVIGKGGYDADAWLDRYVECMRTPGWHRDTYIEEVHRGFFEKRARGIPLRKCGIDDLHIGGLAQVPALVAALKATDTFSMDVVLTHVSLTHHHPDTLAAAGALVRMLCCMAEGGSLQDALSGCGASWAGMKSLDKWAALPDRTLVGRKLSTACYLPESFTASLALVWKHRDDFTAGILANALCGGDSCHRGAVVGALLGAAHPIPQQWIDGLMDSTGVPAKRN